MKVKVVTIDFQISARAKRAIQWIALPIAVFAGSIAVASAGSSLPTDQPSAWSSVAGGQPVSATNMKALFSDLDTRLQALEAAAPQVPAGTIAAYGGAIDGTHSPPAGWLLCDGSQLNGLDTRYQRLYTAIGTSFGGNTTSQAFNVPDLRGVFIRGFDPSGSNVASESGRVFGSKQDGAFASHSHGVSDPGHAHGVNDPGHGHSLNHLMAVGGNWTFGGNNWAVAVDDPPYNNFTVNPSLTGVSIQASATGISIASSGGAETRPVNVTLNYVIKL